MIKKRTTDYYFKNIYLRQGSSDSLAMDRVRSMNFSLRISGERSTYLVHPKRLKLSFLLNQWLRPIQ